MTARHLGSTPEQIHAFSQNFYDYIGHEQLASTGFMVTLGIAMITLAWYGIRRGERWALLTAFLSQAIAEGIALALLFSYGIDTLVRLEPIYLGALILLAGTVVAYVGLRGEKR